jgi:hypothetical protein
LAPGPACLERGNGLCVGINGYHRRDTAAVPMRQPAVAASDLDYAIPRHRRQSLSEAVSSCSSGSTMMTVVQTDGGDASSQIGMSSSHAPLHDRTLKESGTADAMPR